MSDQETLKYFDSSPALLNRALCDRAIQLGEWVAGMSDDGAFLPRPIEQSHINAY